MPGKPDVFITSGRVTELFGHRFVIATSSGKILADLGPRGAEEVKLAVGDEVSLSGEQKPTEVKVRSLSINGRDYELKSDAGPKHEDASPAAAVAAIRSIGFEPIRPAIRKPKHFEIVACRGEEQLEFHVEFDGAIRKTKPAKAQKAGARL